MALASIQAGKSTNNTRRYLQGEESEAEQNASAKSRRLVLGKVEAGTGPAAFREILVWTTPLEAPKAPQALEHERLATGKKCGHFFLVSFPACWKP